MSLVGVLLWLCFTGLLAGVLSALYVREQHRLDECNTRSEQQSTQSTDAQRQHREAEADLTQRAERAIHRKEVELATLQRTTQTELVALVAQHIQELEEHERQLQAYQTERRRLCRALVTNPLLLHSPSTASPLKLMTVTKNEPGLIDAWLYYHTRIFGAENIVVYDNLSTDENHLRVYAKYPRLDLRVTPHYTQGVHALDVCHGMESGLVVCLDTDEFLVTSKGEVDADVLRAHLLNLLRRPEPAFTYAVIYETVAPPSFDEELVVSSSQGGVVVGQALRVPLLGIRPPEDLPISRHCHKIIVRAEAMTLIRDGYHSCNHAPLAEPELALIHFHHRPFLTHVQHAVYDLQGFGTLPPGDLLGEGSQELYERILAAPPGGCGAHKLAFLQRTLRGCLDHGGSAPPTRADYERYYATLPPPALAAERENVIGTLFQKRLDAAAASGPLVVHQLGEAVGPSDAD